MNRLVKLETLDTSFVNLGALIRYLRQRNFVGRVRVVLEEYEADVFLRGAEEPNIWEKNLATGRGAQGNDAMQRVLVRARDPGGLITIYEAPADNEVEGTGDLTAEPVATSPEAIPQESPTSAIPAPVTPAADTDWERLIAASGELVSALERAVASIDDGFASRFRAALTSIGDDYPFLDPTAGLLEYRGGKILLHDRPAASDFIAGLTEALSRLVSRLVNDESGLRIRERVAVELVVVARRNENAFAEFTPYLDRIAGTRVL